MKYYLCSVCGNLVEMVDDHGNTPSCCGRAMAELKIGSTDGNPKTHIPHVMFCAKMENGVQKINIQVGEEAHPMRDFHHIQWISIETCCGVHRAILKAEDEPKATFYLRPEEKIRCIYAYCNLHGLWMKPMNVE